jgi:hypothetical protein
VKPSALEATALSLAAALLLYAWRENAQIRGLRQGVRQAEAENQRLAVQGSRDAAFRERQAAGLAAEEARVGRLLSEISSRERRGPGDVVGSEDQPPAGARSYAKAANVGQSTPLKTFESAIWATYHGDVDALGKMLNLDPAAKDAAAKIFAGLPADSLARFQNPEYMTALLIEYAYPSGGTYEVSWSAPLAGDPDKWVVGTKMVTDSGQTSNGQFTMQRNNGNWMLLVPAPVVQHLGELLSGPGNPQ